MSFHSFVFVFLVEVIFSCLGLKLKHQWSVASFLKTDEAVSKFSSPKDYKCNVIDNLWNSFTSLSVAKPKAACFRLSRKEGRLLESMFWVCRPGSFGSFLILVFSNGECNIHC